MEDKESVARIKERRIGGSQLWRLLMAIRSHTLEYFLGLTWDVDGFKGNIYTKIGHESEEEFARIWIDIPGVTFNDNMTVIEEEPEDEICGSKDKIVFAITPDVWYPNTIIEIKTTCPLSADYPLKEPKIEHKAQLLCYMAFTNCLSGTIFNAKWYKRDDGEWATRCRNYHYQMEADELRSFARDLRLLIRQALAMPKRLSILAAEADRLMNYIRNKKKTTEKRDDFNFIGSFAGSTYLGSLLEAVSHD